jgi:hypothetical protein
MQQCESLYLKPSQSTSMPGKPVVDQPSEPQWNRIKDSVQSELILYHCLKKVSSSRYFHSFLHVVRSRNVQPFCNYFQKSGSDNRVI